MALEGQFLGNAEFRALQLDATFRTFAQGDLSVGGFCRRMKGMADAFRDLGCPVSDRVLVLNVLRGLTCRAVRSKHRYPLWSGEYPRNTQRVERRASL